MSASPVRRCIAVASHGRRCQQSPFRGSPYCWHHLQSRKVPATSRPPNVTRLPERAVDEHDRPAAVDRTALAVRLAHELEPDVLAALVAFVEDRRDPSLTLVRTAGHIAAISRRPHPRVAARA